VGCENNTGPEKAVEMGFGNWPRISAQGDEGLPSGPSPVSSTRVTSETAGDAAGRGSGAAVAICLEFATLDGSGGEAAAVGSGGGGSGGGGPACGSSPA